MGFGTKLFERAVIAVNAKDTDAIKALVRDILNHDTRFQYAKDFMISLPEDQILQVRLLPLRREIRGLRQAFLATDGTSAEAIVTLLAERMIEKINGLDKVEDTDDDDNNHDNDNDDASDTDDIVDDGAVFSHTLVTAEELKAIAASLGEDGKEAFRILQNRQIFDSWVTYCIQELVRQASGNTSIETSEEDTAESKAYLENLWEEFAEQNPIACRHAMEDIIIKLNMLKNPGAGRGANARDNDQDGQGNDGDDSDNEDHPDKNDRPSRQRSNQNNNQQQGIGTTFVAESLQLLPELEKEILAISNHENDIRDALRTGDMNKAVSVFNHPMLKMFAHVLIQMGSDIQKEALLSLPQESAQATEVIVVDETRDTRIHKKAENFVNLSESGLKLAQLQEALREAKEKNKQEVEIAAAVFYQYGENVVEQYGVQAMNKLIGQKKLQRSGASARASYGYQF